MYKRQEYPLALQGGVSVLVCELARGLAADFAVTLVSPDRGPDDFPEGLREFTEGHVSLEPVASGAGLGAELRARGVRLAHFHWGGNYTWQTKYPGRSPILGVRRAGIRCLSTLHLVVDPMHGLCDPARPSWQRRALLAAAWLSRMHVLARSEAEFGVSQHDTALLRHWYAPLARRIEPLYHSRLSETGAGPVRPDSERKNHVLSVGHVAFRKGQHVLAEAFARLAPRHPSWTLHILGDELEPACADRIRQIAAQPGLGDRIRLEGPSESARDWMREARIFVQPSLQEALGLALQEALFEGCACIGTRAGGIPELIRHDQNGVLVAPGDVGEMAAALDRLMNGRAERERLAAQARPSVIARGMTRERMIAAHRARYTNLITY